MNTATFPKLVGSTVDRDALTSLDRQQMLTLMQRYYDNVREQEFEHDLADKDWVLLARCSRTNVIRGFSTQQFRFQSLDQGRVGVLFSGDTIVAHRYWARNPLATLWGRLALRLIDQSPGDRLVWFLISKGYKTYRYLPVFFHEFYPRPEASTPPWAQNAIDGIARLRFGNRYRPSRGVITAEDDGCRLKHDVAEIDAQRMLDPYVAFFQKVNPDHISGDELACLAPLTRENLNQRAYRVIAARITAAPYAPAGP